MDKCFICDRPIRVGRSVMTKDGQKPLVGTCCYKLVHAAPITGYQPPKGGPRLFIYVKP